MANTLLTIDMITRESLRVLENGLVFAKKVSRKYDDKFGVSGAKIGSVINVRKPARYEGRTGKSMSIENHTETSVPVALTTQFGVDLQFDSEERALELDEFSERVLKPALAVVANKIDFDGLSLYKDIYNCVGSPGSVPTALLTYLQARQKLAEEACPMDDMLTAILNPEMEVNLVDNLKGLFQSAEKIAQQYSKGTMGKAAGFTFAMDQNVNAHTNGTYAGTPRIKGASQTGASLITDGWSSTSLKVGDIFTIADVYAVNPQNRQSTGQLRQFRVVEDQSDTAGDMTLTISPSIVLTGPFKTVDSLPANDALISVLGNSAVVSPQGLAFHRDAFTLVCADLPLPGGAHKASRVSDKQLGLSIRMIEDYDIRDDLWPFRLDILYGWKTLYPELACRIAA